ncbi:MAG: ABC transporter permease [Candidatus Omnitrophica bacterium]|nr:ABC transporter permease [Candidatus Omnitrophota bacterium]
MWLNKLGAFLKRDFLIETSYRTFFILRVLRILTTTLTFYFISKLFEKNPSNYLEIYGGDYFSFVLIGIAFSEYLTTSLRSFSESLREEQITGTLEAVLVTPTKISTVILGSSIWNYIFTTISVLIYLGCGVLFFDLSLTKINFLSGILILTLTIICFASIGIISSSFVLIFKKGEPLSWFTGICFSLLGGVYFPVEIMPKFLRFFSYLVPVSYGLRGIRLAFLKGYDLKDLWFQIVMLLIFIIILFPLSIFILKWAVKKIKKEASLLHY